MFETTLYQGHDFAAGAKLCIKHRLFVAGWDLLPTLQYLKDNPRTSRLAVGFVSQIPVALALYDPTGSGMVMSFCRKDQRRKGYGSACVKTLDLKSHEHVWAGEGIEGTHLFWEKNRVSVNRRARFL